MIYAEITLHDATFRAILLPALLGTLGLMVATAVSLFVFSRPSSQDSGQPSWLVSAVYFFLLAATFVLAATAFGTILKEGHMGGYALMAHTSVAGAFVFLLLGAAAGKLWTSMQGNSPTKLQVFLEWVLLVGSVIVAGSMFLVMLPILNTEEALTAIAYHRYAGLVTTIAACLIATASTVRFLLGRKA